MTSVALQVVTPREYLEIERKAETKSEYYNGRIYAMSGASRAHILISGNVSSSFVVQLRDRPCEAYMGDMRIKVSQTGLYTYPGVAVVCEEPEFDDVHTDTLLNPAVSWKCCRHLRKHTTGAASSGTISG